MNKEQLTEALKNLKESSKRNFNQTIDLIINLKGIDLKKTEHQVNTFVTLHYSTGKKIKICALVGPELLSQAKEVCDNAVSIDEFPKYTQKKDIRKLANDYDYFIAQATIMPQIAKAFGRFFGPKGKMPNPKAGCVVPPNANLNPLYQKLQKTIKLQTKNDAIIQCGIGKQDSKDEEVIDNALTIYDALIHVLPNEKHNIKNVLIKLTMSKPVKIGEKKGKEDSSREDKKAKKQKIIEPEKKEKPEEETKEKKQADNNPNASKAS